ncbi:DUF4872 domain-containing protein [Geodermatophilus sp. CPCC 205506]|uniref:DUF4872 domain-containing protein n=1 Tax=Geodermatophilus sp. CPCC 205506 TaxID=2936596 RepID=UPI003EEAFEB1
MGGCTSTTARWRRSPCRSPTSTGRGPGSAATGTPCSSSAPPAPSCRPTGCAPRCSRVSGPPSTTSAAARPPSPCPPGAGGRGCSSTARAAKGWPTVFADGRGLLRALASVWEAVEPAGMDGGHLRGLFADGLAQAAAVLDEPELVAEAQRWREIATRWHALAETALPDDVPTIARLRELSATVTGAVAEGDAGAGERATAAEELWRLRAEHADAPPLDGDRLAAIRAEMSRHLGGIHDAEVAAVRRLGGLLAGA